MYGIRSLSLVIGWCYRSRRHSVVPGCRKCSGRCVLACLRSDCMPTHLRQSRRVRRDGATVLGHLVFVVTRMLLLGRVVGVVCKLHRGRGPTLSVYLVYDDISVVRDLCNGLVCGDMVGRPSGMRCYGLIYANLRLSVSWASHRIPSVVCWRPLRWWGSGVVAVVSAGCVCVCVGELWGVGTMLVPRMVLASFPISPLLRSLLPWIPSVYRCEVVLASSVCTLDYVVVVHQCLSVACICCHCGHAIVILVGGDPGVGSLG